MSDSTLVLKAISFANEKHAGQLDDSGKPYILHPVEVLRILDQITSDEVILSAGVLHDTLEDTDTTFRELVTEFGQEVADLVYEVTHEGAKDNYGYYFPRLKSQKAILIKFADRLSNLSRMEPWDEKRRQQYLDKSKFWKDGSDKE